MRVSELPSNAPQTDHSNSSALPQVQLSVIVPAYRQGRLIYGNLRRLLTELDKLNVTYEVIVVSDGNTDATVREAQRLGSPAVRVFHYPMNIGKGFALSFGVSQSVGTLVTFIDADMKFDPANINRFMKLMRTTKCDAVIGSKLHPESRVSYPTVRKLQSALFQWLIRLLFNLNVQDTLSGLKLIRRDVLEDVLPFLTAKTFVFDLELLVVAQLFGYRVLEAPIQLRSKFGIVADPRVVGRILLDTMAVFFRLRISGLYSRRWQQLLADRKEAVNQGLSGHKQAGALRILILNWRCPTNPRGGGAETVTYEVARRFVRGGDTVEWFGARFKGSPPEETIDGIHIVRDGRPWTVHWRAFRRYRKRLKQDFDIVIDECNAIPFFAPMWSAVPVVLLIHQLIREVWWYETRFPLNVIGFLAEPLYLRWYRDVPVLTVSASTKSDLRRLGFRGTITIIPEGLETLTQQPVTKPNEPHFLYVGRLVPSKRLVDVIRAFAIFRNSVGPAHLCLLGSGADAHVGELRSLVHRLGLSDYVRFAGRLSSSDKHREMAKAHVLLIASAREGWGLVVTEANAFGTPAIGYDVPGLRDSIQHYETGLLVGQSPEILAEAMSRLWQDRGLYQNLSEAAMASSAAYSFERTANVVRSEVTAILARPQTPASKRASEGVW